MPYPKIPPAERFRRRVQVGTEDECWPWVGARDRDGYGFFLLSKYPRKVAKSHRFAFLLAYGYWPNICRHHCDNPACCNPRHLADGTQAANVADMWTRHGERETARRRRSRGGTKAYVPRQRRDYTGANNPNARIDAVLAEEVRTRYATRKESQQTIADSLGISQAHVSRIIRGEVWKDGGNT